MSGTKTPAAAAAAAAEAIRGLSHELAGDGLTYPSDAYDVIGGLRTLADRLPQALGLVARWLQQQHDRGAVAHDSGDASEYVLAAADALTRARRDAELLAAALGGAHQAAAGLKTAG